MDTIVIKRHLPALDIDEFIQAGHEVFRGDPSWVAPLRFMLEGQLSPRSPFFQHAEVVLFTARRRGQLVGRISAQVDWEHQKRYGDRVGFFGFFDTVDDPEVGRALVDRAAQWLAGFGMTRMRGPLSLSINQEVGTLVEGFDTPPSIMMPHARPHQDRIAQLAGLQKVRDLFAWRWTITAEPPARMLRGLEAMSKLPEVRFRSVDLEREIDTLVRIQDDAWRHNWGHVSMTEPEAHKLRDELKLILDPEVATVVDVDGEIAGMALAVPNLNEVIRDFSGKLSPSKVAKLIWRLKVRRPTSGRVAMLGIKESVRKQKKYMPLALALIADLNARGHRRGYRWAELSWTLEDNASVNSLIRAVGGEIYKRYRLYEKPIEGCRR
jgi:hypothetical protein